MDERGLKLTKPVLCFFRESHRDTIFRTTRHGHRRHRHKFALMIDSRLVNGRTKYNNGNTLVLKIAYQPVQGQRYSILDVVIISGKNRYSKFIHKFSNTSLIFVSFHQLKLDIFAITV